MDHNTNQCNQFALVVNVVRSRNIPERRKILQAGNTEFKLLANIDYIESAPGDFSRVRLSSLMFC